MRSVLGGLLEDAGEARDVVVDMEAGLEHLSRGTTRHVETLLAIAEPYYRSMETARRTCELATELGIRNVRLVANKVRAEEDAEALADFAERHGMPLAGMIPYDEHVARADRRGLSFFDSAPADAPARTTLAGIVRDLLEGGPD